MILVVLVMLRNGGDCIIKEVLVLEKREARGVARVVTKTYDLNAATLVP